MELLAFTLTGALAALFSRQGFEAASLMHFRGGYLAGTVVHTSLLLIRLVVLTGYLPVRV